MSLINQALRKAQRDRTPDRASVDGATSQSAAPTSPTGSMSPTLIRSLMIACGVLVILVVGLLIVLLTNDTSPPAAEAQPVNLRPEPAATAQAPSPTQELVDPVITSPKTATPPTPPVPAIESNIPNVVEELRKAREATEAALAAQNTEPQEPTANDAIIDWLSQVTISGVRISDSGNKMILNGKTYASGEIVHSSLGLRVAVIQEKRILFIDRSGKKYMKRL